MPDSRSDVEVIASELARHRAKVQEGHGALIEAALREYHAATVEQQEARAAVEAAGRRRANALAALNMVAGMSYRDIAAAVGNLSTPRVGQLVSQADLGGDEADLS